MTPSSFFYLVFLHPWTYSICLLIISALYFLLFRKKILSLFDPIFLAFLGSALSGAAVIFLYAISEISIGYYYSYLATQIAFLIGFLLLSNARPKSSAMAMTAHVPVSFQFKIISYLSFFLCVLVYILFYYKNGIPLLAESRIAFYYDAGIVSSLINKFIFPLFVCSLACSFVMLFHGVSYEKVFFLFVVFVLAIFAVLSGAKSSLYQLVAVLYLYHIFSERFDGYRNYLKRKKVLVFVFIVSVGAAFLLISIKIQHNNAFTYLLLRLVQSGDTFFYAYPNSVLDSMPSGNIFSALFPGFSKYFGVPHEGLGLGVELFQEVNKVDSIDGPNARHNVFGLLHLGWLGSVFYSFFLGLILSFSRFSLYKLLPANYIGSIVFVVILMSVVGIESDANMAFSKLLGSLFVLGLLLLLSKFICVVSTRRYRRVDE